MWSKVGLRVSKEELTCANEIAVLWLWLFLNNPG